MFTLSVEGCRGLQTFAYGHALPFIINRRLVATSEEVIHEGIASILKTPDRNFITHPLAQDEITAIIETLVGEVNNPKLSEDLAHFYLSVIKFLKEKVLYN